MDGLIGLLTDDRWIELDRVPANRFGVGSGQRRHESVQRIDARFALDFLTRDPQCFGDRDSCPATNTGSPARPQDSSALTEIENDAGPDPGSRSIPVCHRSEVMASVPPNFRKLWIGPLPPITTLRLEPSSVGGMKDWDR